MRGMVYAIGMLVIGMIILVLTITSIGVSSIAEALRGLSVTTVLVFLSLAIIASLLSAYRWRNILKALGHKMPFGEIIQYYFIGYGVGYITPLGRTGSAPARMVLIKRKGVSYTRGFTSIVIDSTLENSFDIIFALIMLWTFFIAFKVPLPLHWLAVFLAISLGILLIMAIFYLRIFAGKGFFSSIARSLHLSHIGPFSWSEKKLREVETTYSWFLRKKPFEIFRVFAISVLTWIVLLTQYHFALEAIGIKVNLFGLILIMVTLALAVITPVPAGVGVLELSQAAIFGALGLPPSIGIAFALLIRLRDFFLTVIGSTFLFGIGARILFTNDR